MANQHSALIASVLSLFWAGHAQACLKYEPASRTASGTILEQEAYGPPNFGEKPDSDDIEIYPLLVLDEAACVDAGGQRQPGMPRINAIQLWLIESQFQNNWIGKHVVVEGKLFQATSEGDRAAVVLQASQIALAPSPAFVPRHRPR
jgi:hypothetical protein